MLCDFALSDIHPSGSVIQDKRPYLHVHTRIYKSPSRRHPITSVRPFPSQCRSPALQHHPSPAPGHTNLSNPADYPPLHPSTDHPPVRFPSWPIPPISIPSRPSHHPSQPPPGLKLTSPPSPSPSFSSPSPSLSLSSPSLSLSSPSLSYPLPNLLRNARNLPASSSSTFAIFWLLGFQSAVLRVSRLDLYTGTGEVVRWVKVEPSERVSSWVNV